MNKKIEKHAMLLYNEPAEVVVPRLMLAETAIHRVAALLRVTPQATRKWVKSRGWVFDDAAGRWVAPVMEASDEAV